MASTFTSACRLPGAGIGRCWTRSPEVSTTPGKTISVSVGSEVGCAAGTAVIGNDLSARRVVRTLASLLRGGWDLGDAELLDEPEAVGPADSRGPHRTRSDRRHLDKRKVSGDVGQGPRRETPPRSFDFSAVLRRATR